MKKALIMGSLVLDITPSLRSDDLRTVEDIFVQGKVTELKGDFRETGKHFVGRFGRGGRRSRCGMDT